MRPLVLALLFVAPGARADDPPRERSNKEVLRCAQTHFARGEYREALGEYLSWCPASGCGAGDEQLFEHRERQIVLCNVHLKRHDRAVVHLLWYAEVRRLPGDLELLLVQLYRAAKQYGDLVSVLDGLERRELVRKQPKWWLLTDDHRKALAGNYHTHGLREMLAPLAFPNVKPYPAALPLPKPGSLPQALP